MTLKLPIYQIDAFTSRAFGGNPAAVMPLDAWLPDAIMQKIALENNLSETVFFVPTPNSPADYHIRWFTPAVEIDLCGHATLAASWVLRHKLGITKNPIIFSSEVSGLLNVSDDADRLRLDFPAIHANLVCPPETVSAALGAMPVALFLAPNRYLALFESAADVAALTPNFSHFETVETGCIIASAPGNDCDFVSRFFAAGVGVDEDPVTGSAHCVLVPYWAARLGKKEFFARQISARGGELWCTLKGDRVLMSGDCVQTLEGMFLIDENNLR